MNIDSLYNKEIMKPISKILLLLSLSLPLFAQQLTLQDAINVALVKNEKIKQYQERLAQKEFDDKSAIGNFLPKINLTGGYTHMNDDLSLDLSPVGDAIITMQASTQTQLANINNVLQTGVQLTEQEQAALNAQYSTYLSSLFPDLDLTFKEQNFKTATLQAVQPLFVGGKLFAAKTYSKAEVGAAASELTKTTNEVITEVVNNYLNVLLLEELVQTRTDVLNGMNRHSTRAKRLQEEGVIASYQALRAQVAVAEAEVNLTDDQSKLKLARIALNNSLGLEESTDIQLLDTLISTEYEVNLDTLLASAYENQPVLQMLDQKEIAAKQKFNIARSSFLPHVAAFGKYEMYPEYLSALEPRWAVGVQMQFNIFNGLKDYMDLQSAKHLQNEVEYIKADTRKKISLWVNKDYNDVIDAQERYNKLDAALELAKESLRLNERRFDTGIGTSLEVIDAQLSLENIEIKRLVSLKDYYQALSDLYLAAGEPLEILKVWNKTEL